MQVRVRRGKTLQEVLCRRRDGQSSTCGNPRCDLCSASIAAAENQQGARSSTVSTLGRKVPCTMRDVVYTAKYQHCPAWYCGETERTLGERRAEHERAVRQNQAETSALAEHNMLRHGGAPNTFDFRVVRRGGGFVMRKCHEALHVEANDPEINRHAPGRGVVNR